MNLGLPSRAAILFFAGELNFMLSQQRCSRGLPNISHLTLPHVHLSLRIFLAAGTALVLGLNLLQVHRRDPEGVWLAVLLLAAGAMVIGLLYPLALGRASAPDISTVMRCLAVFVGIYQATTVSPSLLLSFSLAFFLSRSLSLSLPSYSLRLFALT